MGRSGVVGLELDTGIIRAVEVRGKARPVVVAAGQVVIPETAVVDGMVQDIRAVSEALQKLWAQSRFRTRSVALGIFNQGVMMRLVTFPKVPKDKLKQALQLQGGEYFPIPVSQLVMDCAVLGEITENSHAPQWEVLVVAAKKDMLGDILQALEDSRLTPVVVDASPLAVMRTLPGDKLQGTIAVVDLSNGLSSLLLHIDGKPRFARVMSTSLRHYCKNLSGYLFAEGAVKEQNAAAVEQGLGKEVLTKWSVAVSDDIRASISYYIRQDHLRDVDRIILTGKGARVAGLLEMIQNDLGVEVEIINPFTGIKARENIGISRESDGPALAAGLGLALRGLEV